jgi:hypothetical protein
MKGGTFNVTDKSEFLIHGNLIVEGNSELVELWGAGLSSASYSGLKIGGKYGVIISDKNDETFTVDGRHKIILGAESGSSSHWYKKS